MNVVVKLITFWGKPILNSVIWSTIYKPSTSYHSCSNEPPSIKFTIMLSLRASTIVLYNVDVTPFVILYAEGLHWVCNTFEICLVDNEWLRVLVNISGRRNITKSLSGLLEKDETACGFSNFNRKLIVEFSVYVSCHSRLSLYTSEYSPGRILISTIGLPRFYCS